MQALYTLETSFPSDDSLSSTKMLEKGNKILLDKIESSSDLFTLLLAYLTRTAQYAEVDARTRGAKYLPTDEDKKVNIKIAGNLFVWQLLENATFVEKLKESKLEQYIDPTWVKKLYQKLAETEEYQKYIKEESRTATEDRDIIKHLWYHIFLTNENFIEFISDEWSTWEDDHDMLHMLFENLFKNQKNLNFLKFISSEKKEYAQSLLATVLEKEDYLLELIQPKFKNWDKERIATIDLTLLKMGVAELLYFPTIPTKVTINEYIEVAKQYSTEQSGQFVNGVLDNILKDLTKENAIRKIDRKK